MKSTYLTILSLLISISLLSQITVKNVTSNVAIDGVLEESFWEITNTISIGSSNNTANFGVLWDNNYLYIGVDVQDATLCTSKRQGFYDDGIEICIDGNNNQGTSFDDYDRIFIKPIRSYWIQEMEQRYGGVIHKWIETTNGYSMEFAIPWNNFNITPNAGIDIGFNIIINDDEDCIDVHNTPSQLIWNGNSNYYNNSSIWGTITLDNQTTSYSGNYIALKTPNGGEFLINNINTEIGWISNGISNVNIDYSTDNGSIWNSVATNLSASSGSYSWNVSATPSDNCLIRISETGNLILNDISKSVFTISEPLTAVYPLIPNVWKNYQWPYNAYFPEDAGGINGHVGSACGHASLARILHYWEFPITGNNSLDFTDNAGYSWLADFGSTIYNYDNMPNYLPLNSTEPEYTDVATLTYHAATSMNDYWGSGRDLANMSYAMSHYFNYKVSTPAIRSSYTKAEWINILINELDNGRVLLIDGMTSEFLGDWHENNWVAGHWFHIDGYNENGQFHGVLGFGNEDDWFDIDSLFNYSLNNGILVGLEPNLGGKELSLQTLNNGEIIPINQITQINWNSVGITNVKIEYTINNGQNWTEIINSIPSISGTYNWTTPITASNECKIKITDIDNINVYDKSDTLFAIVPSNLIINSPNGGEQYIAESTFSISWELTSIENIKIEYSINNGTNWNEIIASIPTIPAQYNWVTPIFNSTNCKIKITDITNNTVFDESDNTFEITNENSFALQFDGINDFVEVADFAIPQADLTIEAWIKPTNLINNSTILAGSIGSYGFEMRVESDGSLLYGEYQPWNYVKSSNNSIPINVWTHVAVTRQGTDGTLYINGEVVATYQLNTSKVSDALYIGSKNNSGQEPFEGLIDEVRIWSVARTQAQLVSNNTTYLGGSESGLVNYWRTNESTGQVCFDITNTHNGQLGSTSNIDNNDPIHLSTNWPYTSPNLNILSPNGGGFISNYDPLNITWGNTAISNIKIEYSTNNGTAWTEIISSTPTSTLSYIWNMPSITSSECLIKITDITNPSIFDISDNTFEIGIQNTIGGPYITDNNTVLLLHFNDNLDESSHNYIVDDHGLAKTYISNPNSELSNAIYFDNSSQSNQSYITVPNSAGEMTLSGNWTIEFWFKFNSWNDDFNNWATPILLPTTGFDANYYLEIPASWGKLKYGFANSNGGAQILSSSNSITTEVWYHVALINDYDNHTVKILLHDSNFQIIEEQSSSYTAGITSTGTQDLRIGAGVFTENHFDGYIDELRISNIVRNFDLVSIKKEKETSKNIIYPNPANTNIQIMVSKKVEITITSITGKIIFSKHNYFGEYIDVSNFNSGIYFVNIKNEITQKTHKLIIK